MKTPPSFTRTTQGPLRLRFLCSPSLGDATSASPLRRPACCGQAAMASAEAEWACYLALVGTGDASPSPRVLFRQPTTDHAHTPFPPAVAAFAFTDSDAQHTAVLTMGDGSRLHVSSLRLSRQRALLLLSRVPLLAQSLAALQSIAAAAMRPLEAAIAARALLRLPLPLPGVEMRMRLAGQPLRLATPAVGAPPALGVSLLAFCRRVGVDVAMRCIAILVAELRLALVSRSAAVLGAGAEALMALLHPFEWAHTYIPLLPISLREYVEAPCPFIIGLAATPTEIHGGSRDDELSELRALLPADVCVLDLDAATLSVPPDEPLEPLPTADAVILRDELRGWMAEYASAPSGGVPSAGTPSTDTPPADAPSADALAPPAHGEEMVATAEVVAACDAGANAGAQLAWMRMWRRLVGGYSAHLLENGADIDESALLEATAPERRAFVRQLLASAAFPRHLERVAAGDIVDDLVSGTSLAGGGVDGVSASGAPAAAPAPAAASPTTAVVDSPMAEMVVLELPDDLGLQSGESMSTTGSPATNAAFPATPGSEHGASVDGQGVADPNDHWEQILTWPAEESAAAASVASASILVAVATAAEAAPRSVALQLTYASELMRAGRPMDALGAMELAQHFSRDARTRRRRSSIGDTLEAPSFSSTGSRVSRRAARERRLSELTAHSEAMRVSEGDSGRSSFGHGASFGGGSSPVHRQPSTGTGSSSVPDVTLRCLVRACLAQLDPRRLAELATLREAPGGGLPAVRSRRESATAPPVFAMPSPMLNATGANAPNVAEITDATTAAKGAGSGPVALADAAGSSSWRVRFGQTLRDAAASAAAHRAGLLLPQSPHTPLPSHTPRTPHMPLSGGSGSSRHSSSLSSQRPPLLAVWARAYLDERARAEAVVQFDDDIERATAPTYADRDSDDDDERPTAVEYGYDGSPPPLLERLDGASANGPPAGWGLAIPWPWGVDGSDAAGRRQHVAVEPVLLFSQLHQQRHAESDADAQVNTDGAGEDGGADGGAAAEESGSGRGITWSDFDTFGGELLQVAGAPELSKLWSCLVARQANPATETSRIEVGAGVEMSPRGDDAGADADDAAFSRRLPLPELDAWHTALRTTLLPTSTWRRRLGLEARELLLKRTRRPSVRSEALGVPGMLALTSERLLFGSVSFVTAASLPALRSVRAAENFLGESILRLKLDDGRDEAHKTKEVHLRFGRGGTARAQRDAWAGCLELMRRAYAHAYALASELPIARAAHCVACAAALPSEGDGAPLLQLLPAQPPRSGAPRSGYVTSGADGAQWRLMRLSGDVGKTTTLRIACLAAAGSGFAIGTLGGEIRLYRLRVGRATSHAVERSSSSTSVADADSSPVPPTPRRPDTPPPSPFVNALSPLSPSTPAAAHKDATADARNPPAFSLSPRAEVSPTPSMPQLPPLPPESFLPAPYVHVPPLPADVPAPSSSPSPPPRSAPSPPSPPGPRVPASEVESSSQLVTTEIARAQCDEPARALAFAAGAGGSARLVALTSGAACVWSSRLRSSSELMRADGHRSCALAVASRTADGGSLIAVASEHATDWRVPREIRISELRGSRGETPYELRSLLLPAPVRAMAFCGEHSLCVAHDDEYVLLSLASGSVRELFRFTPGYGAPYLRRLSHNELLIMQPPPRVGERQIGLFLDRKGHVARRSTAAWRRAPVACLARGRALIAVLPNAIEITHPTAEPTEQSLPFPEPSDADDGGDVLLVATHDAVYGLLPPRGCS